MAQKTRENKEGQEPKEDNAPLIHVLDRNISTLISRRAKEEKELSLQERISLAITRFAGSMPFAYLHVAVFGAWIAVNKGWLPILQAWDPTLVVLAMAASVEAIFITTFVLISQNRMAEEDGKRADLALQIALLNEHETTKLVAIASAIAAVVGARADVSGEEVDEMKKSVSPEAVLEEIERQKTQT
jgi:uncharacterized membrane protein